MYELMEEKGTHYITMEYIPGQDLKGLIRQSKQLTMGTTISIAKQVCEGLSEAHKLGTIHRDLKPSNIMIDKEGNARIMDFGIARSLKTKGITGAGVMVGTPEYMSPEQVESKEVDQRSDIYSMGVIFYEMVAGRVPFEGDTPLSVAVKHKTEAPKDPKELNSQLPEDLSRVILTCMEKDKEKRYQTAEELLSELTRIEKGIPTTERVVPKRKPITSREITVTFGLKKLLIPALVVVAIVIIVAVIWQPWSQKEAIPIPSDKPSLAVMYFENNTGDEKLDHWRKMLSDLLITDLSQSKYLRVLSGDRLFKILSGLNQLETETFSSDILKEVAIKGGVNHLLLGKYARMGETFRIDVVLQEASTGEIIGSERVEARGEEEVFPKVDEITRRIKENFKLSAEEIASDIDKEVGKITTSSAEAYKYYIEGREYYHKGESQKNIELMKKAISVDPNFALAYRSLWAASLKDEYIQKAFELRSQLSDKERLWIEGNYYQRSEKTYDKAMEAYKKLTDLYPEISLGYVSLGILYNNLEEWDKAIERFRMPIQNKEEAYWSYDRQAISYMAKGLYDKAKDILEYYLNNFSDHKNIRQGLALNYLCQGKYDLALVEVDRALSFDPNRAYSIARKGDIYLCQGDLIKAEKEYQKLLDLEDQGGASTYKDRLGAMFFLQGKFDEAKNQIKNLFPFDLAYMYLKSGEPEKALEESNRAWSSAVKSENLAWQRQILHYKGLAYLEMNSVDEAQKTAGELKELIEEGLNKKHIRYYHHLLGRIEFEKDNIPKAIEYFKEALSYMPSQFNIASNSNAIFLDSQANAYYKADDLEKAQEKYERITSLTVDRINYGDIYAKSFYMLGKIYEQQGNNAKAIENYEKFLTLWKEADPSISEVEDAKKRLAGLKGK